MQQLIQKLRKNYPEFQFMEGSVFSWSPKDKSILYDTHNKQADGCITLLHELAHGVLKHATFTSDFNLLQLEVEAWGEAARLGEIYDVAIADEHIQTCLDTYRDWLHMRSTCPTCLCNGFQDSLKTYHCINCRAQWTVTDSRLCRPYRKTTKKEAHMRTLLLRE